MQRSFEWFMWFTAFICLISCNIFKQLSPTLVTYMSLDVAHMLITTSLRLEKYHLVAYNSWLNLIFKKESLQSVDTHFKFISKA